MVALGVARWDSGRITEALELAAQAVRQTSERPYETTYFSPHVLLASALIYVRRLDEATAITNSVESAEGDVTSPWRKEPPRSCAPGSPWRRAGSTTRTRWPSQP
jgi:hypothetical protein